MNLRLAPLALALVATVAAAADTGERPAIAWYGTWERALADARTTNRPILLTAAAPQCHGISGLW